MRTIVIDESRITDAGLTYVADGSIATFTFPATDINRQPVMVTARIDGSNWLMFPERSAGHRSILKVMGE